MYFVHVAQQMQLSAVIKRGLIKHYIVYSIVATEK